MDRWDIDGGLSFGHSIKLTVINASYIKFCPMSLFCASFGFFLACEICLAMFMGLIFKSVPLTLYITLSLKASYLTLFILFLYLRLIKVYCDIIKEYCDHFPLALLQYFYCTLKHITLRTTLNLS